MKMGMQFWSHIHSRQSPCQALRGKCATAAEPCAGAPASLDVLHWRCSPGRYSWNKSQLEKARNESQTQTNPFATAVRGIIGGVPTALLTVASITQVESTRYNKCAPREQ